MVHENRKEDFKRIVLQNKRTVFSFNELVLLLNESNIQRLKQKVNYYVGTHLLLNIRKGIYAKPNYNIQELGCKIYTPAYISLESVLQEAGIIFQYFNTLTIVSYLSRQIEVGGKQFQFRKIKNTVLLNTDGIKRGSSGLNIATPERAFLDVLYLNKSYYFDNPNILDKTKIAQMAPIYKSSQLNLKIKKVFKDAGY